MAFVLIACGRNDKFAVEGEIHNAEKGAMLYFEREGVEGVEVLDSASLEENGTFAFESKRLAEPEFYRLRLGNELVHFCVDSTDLITITGTKKGLGGNYKIKGSQASEKIREIVVQQRAFQESLSAFYKQLLAANLPSDVVRDSLSSRIKAYKQYIRLNYIYAEPNKPYSYFALLQQINGQILFNLSDRSDLKCYQAVASCMDAFWPASSRTQNLHNLVLKALESVRVQDAMSAAKAPIDKMSEVGIININLNDKNGVSQQLSSLKGKVVLLDFVHLGDKGAINHNFFLRDLYTKYHSKGFEIYQVGEDLDYHHWRTLCDALPWICVVEDSQTPNAVAASYNVKSLPTFFLISRESELKARYSSPEGVEKAIKELL